MEFCRCSLFVTFVVLTVDQFVGRDEFGGLLELSNRRSIATFEDKLIEVLTTMTTSKKLSLRNRIPLTCA